MGGSNKPKYRPVIKETPQSSEAIRGRGASWSPANRFEKVHVDLRDVDVVDGDLDDEERPRRSTQFFRDGTKTIITRNSSPDVGFETSVNPYRGCEHGCVYCYARPTHEYLGFSAGLDFESKIMVKMDAARLLKAELESPRWTPQVLVMSGVTDPYQPIEKKLRITRGCLEVLAKCRNPVAIITKNRLVTRDVDLLRELAACNAAAVNISVTSLDAKLQRVLEPRASSPEARLDAIVQLRAAGVPVGVMVAPLFEHWLEEHFPDRKEKILGRIRDLRGNGRLNNSQWRTRMTGEGIFAEQIASLFEIGCRRAGIGERPKLSTAAFRRTREQLTLL